ncbi:DUF2514 family protein [Pseudomonas rustica]
MIDAFFIVSVYQVSRCLRLKKSVLRRHELSGLRDWADERAGALATLYDQARVAGQHCEMSYNALIN